MKAAYLREDLSGLLALLPEADEAKRRGRTKRWTDFAVLAADLRAALMRLRVEDPAAFMAVWLVKVQGYSIRDAGRQLGVSHTTAHNRAERGVLALYIILNTGGT